MKRFKYVDVTRAKNGQLRCWAAHDKLATRENAADAEARETAYSRWRERPHSAELPARGQHD